MAAVAGIDTLHIGANDLSVEMGVGGIRNDPELQAELLLLASAT